MIFTSHAFRTAAAHALRLATLLALAVAPAWGQAPQPQTAAAGPYAAAHDPQAVLLQQAIQQAATALDGGMALDPDAASGTALVSATALGSGTALPTATGIDPQATLLTPAAGTTSTVTSGTSPTGNPLDLVGGGPQQWTSPEGLSSSLQIMLLLTVLSVAPAILLMTTCYVRIIIVLGLLRQAIGLQSLPPSQVMTSIALFMTLFVMMPVWTQVYEQAIRPYTAPGTTMELSEAWEAGVQPIRDFMARQIDVAGNHEDVLLFYRYAAPEADDPETFDDIPLRAMLPAYMLSELKTAFLMGFQIYLPFLIVDLVVASVTISMGMLMLPPAVISLPFKLLLFVLVDGWRLVVQMLMDSFGTLAG